MTKDEIIKLAREAGLSDGDHWTCGISAVQRFARACYEAGRTAERSACAIEKELMREVLQVADGGLLPDGSLADTPTLMWAEEYQRKYQARGKP